MSETKLLTGSNKLVVCFGGMMLQMGGIPPFEFLNYLSKQYEEKVDLIFYVDHFQCWYHKGLKDLTHDVESTVEYLNENVLKDYDTVIFMGVSAGGYAAMLFGSLCKVDHVITFIARTQLAVCHDDRYVSVKPYLTNHTRYYVVADLAVGNIVDNHHASHAMRIEDHDTVTVEYRRGVNMKVLRDTGYIRKLLDERLS